jgi:nitronate monooxygenase
MWPDNRLIKLFDIELPIIQAPMAGSAFADMVVAVSEAGGLGSLSCALLSAEQARGELEIIRRKTSRPINVNFFCHQQPRDDPSRELRWRRRLDGYYTELALESNTTAVSSSRAPFDDTMCDLVAEFHPEVVSFHFGLPDRNLLQRVRRAGAKIISSATSVDEARWLEDQGCDAIVAQAYEAGGHRGMFLTQDVSGTTGG